MKTQPLIIRLAHWINVPVLTVMAMSGLQILRAYPYFGPQGETYAWVPLQGWESPDWMRAGGWLAGARHLHFALAWVFVINGLIYVAYLIISKQYKRRMFWPPRDTKPALRQQLYYLDAARFHVTRVVQRLVAWATKKPLPAPGKRLAKPPVDLYNGLQRTAYTGAIALGVLMVWSGLVIWKPVQLHRLGWLLGGYDGARVIHFLGLLALVVFVIIHVVTVAIYWRQFPEIVTGRRDA
jgi:thiosulfate reductase cytochrome b subunit